MNRSLLRRSRCWARIVYLKFAITGSRIQWPEVKLKNMTNLEYQDGARLVLQDVSASYEQYEKETIATKSLILLFFARFFASLTSRNI